MLKQERYDTYINRIKREQNDKAWSIPHPDTVIKCMILEEFLISARLKPLLNDFKTDSQLLTLKFVVHHLVIIKIDRVSPAKRNHEEYGSKWESLRKTFQWIGWGTPRITNQTHLKPHMLKLYKHMDKLGYSIKKQNDLVFELFKTIAQIVKSPESHERFRNRLYKDGVDKLEKESLAPIKGHLNWMANFVSSNPPELFNAQSKENEAVTEIENILGKLDRDK
ncbi:MAG: hypothetical protein CMG00_08015 [Candidatus Marinimicrobia bacterium]|nr:hypothetical protein [Candidatus Neomarinimicrobiota bacterium]